MKKDIYKIKKVNGNVITTKNCVVINTSQSYFLSERALKKEVNLRMKYMKDSAEERYNYRVQNKKFFTGYLSTPTYKIYNTGRMSKL